MGKFSEKFLGAFNSRDDEYDDYEEEFVDDEYEDDGYQDNRSSGAFKKKNVQEEPVQSKMNNPFSRVSKPSRSNRSGGNEVCIFKPSSIEDSREITETLLQGKAVVVNFEGLHVEISQRIIDFISGSCYALDGNLQKISNYIFIATPNSVDISGDFQDLFAGGEGSFDLAGFKSPLL